MSFIQEGLNPAEFDIVIVLLSTHSKFDLLQPGNGLAFAGFFELGLLIFPLPVVDHPTNRRVRIGRNLDQIKPDRLGLLDGFPGIHYPKLLTLTRYDSDSWGPDSFVHPGHVPTRAKPLLLFLSDSISCVVEGAENIRKLKRRSALPSLNECAAVSLKATNFSSTHNERFRISSHTWSAKSLRVIVPRSSRSR